MTLFDITFAPQVDFLSLYTSLQTFKLFHKLEIWWLSDRWGLPLDEKSSYFMASQGSDASCPRSLPLCSLLWVLLMPPQLSTHNYLEQNFVFQTVSNCLCTNSKRYNWCKQQLNSTGHQHYHLNHDPLETPTLSGLGVYKQLLHILPIYCT